MVNVEHNGNFQSHETEEEQQYTSLDASPWWSIALAVERRGASSHYDFGSTFSGQQQSVFGRINQVIFFRIELALEIFWPNF